MIYNRLMIGILSITTLIISSCMKHEAMVIPNLNINFPAAYVVNGTSNNIMAIKLSDHSIAETITLNGASFPHHIYLNPSKTKLAVAITSTDLSAGHAGHATSSAGMKIMIIDVVTGVIDKELNVAKMPHNAIFNSSGTELWVGQTDLNQSQIIVYNTSDWTVKNTINVGKGLSEVTFSSDGLMAYACNTTDGTTTILNANTKLILTTLSVGIDPIGAWSATNGKMYVDNETGKTVTEISVAGMNITQRINLGFKPGYVAHNPIQNELWVSDATNGKVVYYTLLNDIWTVKGNIPTGADAHAITFTPDYLVAYVTNQGANTVSVINVASHNVTKTINVGTKPNGIALK